MRAIRVFISHSHEDMEMATRLSDTLGQLDVVPFIAHSDIMGGELWKETIRDEIVECDVLVALLTTNFRKSEFTEQEVYRRIKVRDHSSGKPRIGHLI